MSAKQTQYVTTGAPAAMAFGVIAQGLWRLPPPVEGLEVGYRFAYYEPSDKVAGDLISEHTALVAYRLSAAPLRFALQGTLRSEEPGVELNNNSVDLLMQAIF